MYAGVDSHKDTLAVAVIDAGGRVVSVRQLPNDAAGFAQMAAMAVQHGVARIGIEGSTNYGWAAAMHLLEAGLTVVEVPPLMTSRERIVAAGAGQDRPGRRVAIARITAREENLPAVRPMTGPTADLRVLVDYREQLVAERTALANRVHVDLCWLRPGHQHALPRLTQPAHLQAATGPAGRRSERPGGGHPPPAAADDRDQRRARSVAPPDRRPGHRQRHLADRHLRHRTIVAARILAEVVDIARYPTATLRRGQRLRAYPGLLRADRAPPAQPRRQPPTQPRALHDRDHRDPRRHRRPRLLPAQTRRRKDRPRSTPLPETTPLRRHLQAPCAPTSRRSRHPGSTTSGGRVRAVDVEVGNGTRLTAWASCAAGLAVPILLFASARHPRPPHQPT